MSHGTNSKSFAEEETNFLVNRMGNNGRCQIVTTF